MMMVFNYTQAHFIMGYIPSFLFQSKMSLLVSRQGAPVREHWPLFYPFPRGYEHALYKVHERG